MSYIKKLNVSAGVSQFGFFLDGAEPLLRNCRCFCTYYTSDAQSGPGHQTLLCAQVRVPQISGDVLHVAFRRSKGTHFVAWAADPIRFYESWPWPWPDWRDKLYAEAWTEANAKSASNFLRISTSRDLLDRVDKEPSIQKKFEVMVKAYCVDCTVYGEPIPPPDSLFDHDFLEMLSHARKPRRPGHDWEIILVKGWLSKGYYKMDRHELAAAVNPLLKRRLKKDTLWKYAVRLELRSFRSPGPKPRSEVQDSLP